MSDDNRDRVMGHGGDNDGIEEYDNPLPDWWLGLLFFTIVWAVGYFVDYHFISHRSQAASYDGEIAAANERWPVRDTVAAIDRSPAAVEAGAKVYQQNCTGCHGVDLHGGIGPNLTDATWIHGGKPTEIQSTITKGVPAKGMLTWGPILGPSKIAQVTAFVLSRGPAEGQ